MVQNKDIKFEIVLALLSKELYLREISRFLKVSHTTLSRKIKELLKENILDFKIEGKNKIFFLKKNLQVQNYVLNSERYKLIKLLEKYPKLNLILEEMISLTNGFMVILFGSYAKFSADSNSDIDIYIETTSKSIKEKVEKINSKINVKLGEFNKESLLIKEIIKNHIILRGAEEFYEKINN